MNYYVDVPVQIFGVTVAERGTLWCYYVNYYVDVQVASSGPGGRRGGWSTPPMAARRPGKSKAPMAARRPNKAMSSSSDSEDELVMDMLLVVE